MVRIIGGGFSALTLAEALAEKNIPFELFEASPRLGGLIQTEKLQNGMTESAANGLLWSPELESLCARINLAIQDKKKSARKRWIFAKGKPHRWPVGFGGTVNIVKWLFNFKFRPQSVQPREGQSLNDYGLSNLGSEVTQNLLRPAMHGIYGPLFRELSANLILGKYFDLNRRRIKPRTVSFHDGMGALITAIAQKVSARGKIHLNKKINLTELGLNSGPIIICTGLQQTLGLLRERYPDAMPANRLISSGLISVTLLAEKSKNQLSGFGCLFSDLKDSEGVMGVLFNSEIFEDRAQGKIRSETWIVDYDREKDLNDEEIVSVVIQARDNFLNCKSKVIESRVWRWPEALPVYSTDLEKWLSKLGPYGERALAGTPVRIHGNYMGEIGLSAILQRSQLLAEKLEKML